MNHLLIGAALPFAVSIVVYACRGFRASMLFLCLVPLVMTAGMCWAIAPDLPRLFGNLELYNKLSFDPGCDVFLWHYSFDQVEADRGWYGAGLLAMMACLLGAAWRELLILERK